ncbi:MAG TPA: YlxR family protein [Actinomycetota bacterium]|nr:YlxR family protein [Actinomycetota bacterium]
MSAHVPERTCVGCRGRAPKAELLRVYRSPDGSVVVDPGGYAAGRGAYVHRDRACVDEALRRGGVGRALRTRLDEDGAATLRAEIEGELGS